MTLLRPSIDAVLMATATIWSDRSTCSRNKVGVVIARDGRTISTGYNGAPQGMAHCEHPPPMTFGSRRVTPENVELYTSTSLDRGCKVAIHGEANALAYAARHGVAVEGATLYTTLSPCYPCSQLIIAAGLARVCFDRSYRDPAGIDLLRTGKVTVVPMREL